MAARTRSSALNLVGLVFGKLTVVRRANGAASHSKWECACACGRTKVIRGTSLVTAGKPTRSCGCLAATNAMTHGGTLGGPSPEHVAWRSMRRRCAARRGRDWRSYGARGIKVCARWAKSFPLFLVDMGPRPSPQHSLDRKNNEGGYEPGNCRWATRTEQANNRRTCRMIAYGGETMSVAAWARRHGLSEGALRSRLDRGVPVSQATQR